MGIREAALRALGILAFESREIGTTYVFIVIVRVKEGGALASSAHSKDAYEYVKSGLRRWDCTPQSFQEQNKPLEGHARSLVAQNRMHGFLFTMVLDQSNRGVAEGECHVYSTASTYRQRMEFEEHLKTWVDGGHVWQEYTEIPRANQVLTDGKSVMI